MQWTTPSTSTDSANIVAAGDAAARSIALDVTLATVAVLSLLVVLVALAMGHFKRERDVFRMLQSKKRTKAVLKRRKRA